MLYILIKYSGIVLNIILKVQVRLKLKHCTMKLCGSRNLFCRQIRLFIYAVVFIRFYQVVCKRHGVALEKKHQKVCIYAPSQNLAAL